MNMQEQLIKWRRDLHQIPELAFQEFQTATYIRQELKNMGYIYYPILETGTYVYIDYGCSSTIAFRSDMDALPIFEKNDVEYCSQHPHIMHACGHDGHMSALLGLAKKLKETKMDFPYNVLFIFQPAEETIGGAKLIVESGLLQKYHVQAIYGMHLMPYIDEGVIACKSGSLMAMCSEVDITIHGKQAHVGVLQEGIDSLFIASLALHQYQNIKHHFSPFAHIIFHIGKIEGGVVRNSVSPNTKMYGTFRCFDEKDYQTLTRLLEHIHQGLEKTYHCQIECQITPMYPPVINSSHLYQQFLQCVGKNYLELQNPLMLGEDFSFYQKSVLGLFFFLGTKTEKFQSGLHTETFDFDEKVLEKAVQLYFSLINCKKSHGKKEK